MYTNWEFYDLWRRAGFANLKDLARFCEVTPRTAQNWDRRGAPAVVVKLLRLLARDLDWLGPDWRGFQFHQNEIVGPNGEWITPGMIRAYPHLERALEFYRDKAATAEQARAALTAKKPPRSFVQRLSAAIRAFSE